jgi:signal peptidase I
MRCPRIWKGLWLMLVAGLWALVGLGAGILLAATAPLAFGDRSFTVMSGSMSPAIKTGDVVVERPIAPLGAKVGDVVTFRDPEGSRRLITHRVKGMRASGHTVRFVTKGDANNAVERWSVQEDGRIGRVVYRLPKLGYVLAWGNWRYGRLALLVLPAVLLLIFELVRIWRPEREEVSGEAAPG